VLVAFGLVFGREERGVSFGQPSVVEAVDQGF
jgi:hypothetical protein